jgi:ABC-type nitrate/sulfonate/bicarbonate transport system substrate-binding protein
LQDLAGAKFGVSRLSGAEHAYGLLVANQLGLKDAQFIGTGGIRESLAVLTTGSVDALILAPQNLIELKLSGKVRRLAWVSEYLPKPWVSYTVVASKRMIESHPEVVKRTVASLMAANKFLMSAEGKPWAIAKMKEVSKYSDRGAEEVYESLSLQSDGKLEKQSLQNVSSFMTEYGLLKDGEAPNIDTLFTNQFVQ